MDTLAPGILVREFIYDSAPFPSCHAATLLETKRGLLAAYFGGTHERHPDVCIYTSLLRPGGPWSAPAAVADGVQGDGTRLPTWNPVLFQPRGGPVMLFYKVGPNPREWWGMVKTSDDDGATWSDARRLPEGILGPIKNKPEQLADGTIISPTSVELVADPNDDGLRASQSSVSVGATPLAAAPALARTPESGWHVYFELSADGGRSWRATPWAAQPQGVKAIQPSLLRHPGNTLQAIGRTKSGRLFDVWSRDGGQTWGLLRLIDLPNCNSGTDAVTLRDGRHLLVYNHSNTEKVRYPLNLAVSGDGQTWRAAGVIEREAPGQYSYPAVIQTSDGLAHVAYTWKRLRIRHVVIDPSKIEERPISEAVWPGG